MKNELRGCNRHQLRTFTYLFCTIIIVAFSATIGSAQASETFESPQPMLLKVKDSPFALVVNSESWRGKLPRQTAETFQLGQQITIFVSNLDLLPGETGNAFRIFAVDEGGRRFRFQVENIVPVPKIAGVYALSFRIFDPNGYSGQPATDSDLVLTVSWRGILSNSGRLDLGNRIRQSANRSPLPPTASQSTNATNVLQFNGADRKRFMEQAAFGPSKALDNRLRRVGLRAWINEQFVTPYPTTPYPNFPPKPTDGVGSCGIYGTSPEVDLCHRNHYWNYNNAKWLFQEALYGDDQLRRRISWALHKIWVVSHANIGQQRGIQEYIEILDRNSFANYRTLMYEMTLSPAMGEYLDMVRSTKQNPNENYPRELLQLFTTGLYMLNQDGTLRLDGQGNRVPTYDQGKIDQFTKVFTGWTHCNNGNNPECANAVPAVPNMIDPMHLPSPNNHDQTVKALFDYPGAPNQIIAACSNCTTDDARRAYAVDSLNKTLDNIFSHPNVGPFVSKLMIQHLVTSDPSPAYVGRVAATFNDNGVGVRGDMKAVIRAILLDPEARGSAKTDPTYGKLREPVEHLTNVMRVWNVKAGTSTRNGPATPPASCNGQSDGVFEYLSKDQGQDVWMPSSVFSYFSPDYVVPGTDVLGPEFALANTGSSFVRNSHVYHLMYSYWFELPTAAEPYPGSPCGTSLDLSEAESWAVADPTSNMLIEGVNRKMMHSMMSEAMKTKLRTAIDFDFQPRDKALQVVFLVATSSQYQIQR